MSSSRETRDSARARSMWPIYLSAKPPAAKAVLLQHAVTSVDGGTTAAVLVTVFLSFLLVRSTSLPTEVLRKALTFAYRLQGWLPSALASKWRTAVTLALHALPAIDPATDTYLDSVPERCEPFEHSSGGAVLITGGTGMVGVHLIDHLLRTSSRTLYVIVRAKSAGKIQREAAKYKLSLPGFEARVRLLDGDCKRADLGLSAAQWADLGNVEGAHVSMVFHLAANSSFIATYEVRRATGRSAPRLARATRASRPPALPPTRAGPAQRVDALVHHPAPVLRRARRVLPPGGLGRPLRGGVAAKPHAARRVDVGLHAAEVCAV